LESLDFLRWIGIIGLAIVLDCAGTFGQPPPIPIPDLMVPMRDGVHLATDVYLPIGKGPWPTILMRTPYGKRNSGPIDWQGYAVVIQDMRGYGDSEGERRPFETDGWGELQDGYDTVEWIADQPWSNGKVGTYGASALGIAQHLMAGSYPPHLVCQHIAMAPFDIYSQFVYRNGILMKSFVETWMKAYSSPDLLDEWISSPGYSSKWKRFNAGERVENMTFPGFHVGGWYDIFSQGTLDAFTEKQHSGGPGSKGNQRLVMGPWTHNGSSVRRQGDLIYPSNSVYDEEYHLDAKRFFDCWLRGEDDAFSQEPVVRYYVMGDVDDPEALGNEWRTSADWPVPHRNLSLYLSHDGLRTEPGKDSYESYLYDPRNPVPTLGGANIMIKAGPMDQRPVEDRGDVLVYTTEPLECPVEITGRVWVQLFASSSCPDTDFMAKLTDVYPDGRSMLVLDGAIRARYRESTRSGKLMDPGRVYEFWIDLWSTSIVFAKGHRIRLDITSSNYPRFDVNPNTGHPPAADNESKIALNTIFQGKSYPSRIILPLTGPDSDSDGLYDFIDPEPTAITSENIASTAVPLSLFCLFSLFSKTTWCSVGPRFRYVARW